MAIFEKVNLNMECSTESRNVTPNDFACYREIYHGKKKAAKESPDGASLSMDPASTVCLTADVRHRNGTPTGFPEHQRGHVPQHAASLRLRRATDMIRARLWLQSA